MSNLVDFLKSMGKDSNLEDEFGRDPDAVMERFGLSDDEKAAVKSGDADKVKAMCGLEDVRTTNSSVKAYD